MTQNELVIGRIYFGFSYEDDALKYPIIHSYEYRGLSKQQSGHHHFRCIGSNDAFLITDEDLEFISATYEISELLSAWADRNPHLAS
jgi:hypothetical protein